MAKNQACDSAILKAQGTNPEVDRTVRNMVKAQIDFNDAFLTRMNEEFIRAHVPTPSRGDWYKMKKEYRESVEAWLGTKTPEEQGKLRKAIEALGGYSKIGWDAAKQIRVALMLSNWTTHALNSVVNATQAGVIRPAEEITSIAISKLSKEHKRSFEEMHYYGRGLYRAALDVPSVFGAMYKLAKSKGAVSTDITRSALREVGYAEDLATGKPDIMMTGISKPAEKGEGAYDMLRYGVHYLFNVAFGSQFSALQSIDTGFKMIAHRSKVEQLLARQGIKEGLYGKELDRFVSGHWDEMSKSAKQGGGGSISDLAMSVEQRGIRQAAEDTFTETPHTSLGKFLTKPIQNPNTWWKKTVDESIQIISPFRAIYVNLMRQSLSRRFMPFFDPQTMRELSGKAGKEAQITAWGRTTAAWTLGLGTVGVLTASDMKIWGANDMDPEVRQLQFELYGKVGNTIQIGDKYIPLDMLPPSYGIPLAYMAALRQGIDEFNYKYVSEEDKQAAVLKAMVPLMRAVTDGPWVADYMNFLNSISGHLNYGSPDSLARYLMNVAISPVEPPKWIRDMFGQDPHLYKTDDLYDKFLADFRGDLDRAGWTRNMFGERILPFDRAGDQPDAMYPWFKGREDVSAFLAALEFDKEYPRNASKRISAGGEIYGVPAGEADIEMPEKARDRFEEIAGKENFGAGSLEMQLRTLMYQRGVYDPETNQLIANKVQTTKVVKDLIEKRKRMARDIIKYDPRFGLAEQQANLVREIQRENGVPEHVIDQTFRKANQQINEMRAAYARFYY